MGEHGVVWFCKTLRIESVSRALKNERMLYMAADPYSKRNPKIEHERADAELRRFREEKARFADQLYAREDKVPGSVTKAEWTRLETMNQESRRMQDRVHELARQIGPWIQDVNDQKVAERRQAIAKLLADGNSVKAVAEQLGLSTSTVYKYRKQIESEVGQTAVAPAAHPTTPAVAERPAQVARVKPAVSEAQKQRQRARLEAEKRDNDARRRAAEAQRRNSGCLVVSVLLVAMPVLILLL